MSWAVGYDSRWKRDIGYGVPGACDRPGCGAAIDRGLSYVCGGMPYGGERGCGLYFCGDHLTGRRKDGDRYVSVCGRCAKGRPPYEPTPDTREWVEWKLSDESWGPWRAEHPEAVADCMAALIEDQRYHSPGCTDRVTSHTWESSGNACGTATEISTAPEYLREEWRRDRLAELAGR